MSTMQIPSIQTLRALEAAARLGSYSRAAAELGVTHGAISHRLRALECALGFALFTRDGNGMRPTPEALRLLVPVSQALKLLGTTFPERVARSQVLRLSLLPSMASRWLMPRIGQFRTENPEIDLRIDARLEFAPLNGGGMDCSIRYGLGNWLDVQSTYLGDEVLFPVCSPEYRERMRIVRPTDIVRACLLRHDRQTWRPWLDAAGVDTADPDATPLFSDTNLMLDAAIAGDGIALARARIVANDIASHRLIRLFDVEVRDRYAYYFICPLNLEIGRRRAVECFSKWVEEQFQASR